MIRFEIRGVRFAVPLLSLLAPVLALKLGMRGNIFALLLAVGIHETAHLLAARLLRVDIKEVRILPFGGSMRMENPYRSPACRIALTALAGPAANLLTLLIVSSCAQWRLISFEVALNMARPNIIIFLFNLLPALPLDGGRILVALLTRFTGEKRALLAGIWCGRMLSLLMALAMILGGIKSGIWNISLIFAAVFILSSERNEKSALQAARMMRMQDAMEGFDMREARFYEIDASHSAGQALSLLKPRENAWFVLTKSGRPHALLDSRSILRRMTEYPAEEICLGSIPSFRLCPVESE